MPHAGAWTTLALLLGTLAIGTLSMPLAQATSPAISMYERPPTDQERVVLSQLACVQRDRTTIAHAKLMSRYKNAEDQWHDLQAVVTCTVHAVSDGIMWQREVWCSWRAQQWECADRRTLASFVAQGSVITLSALTEDFPKRKLISITRDVLGLGTAQPNPLGRSVRGLCDVEWIRSAGPLGAVLPGLDPYISLHCTNMDILFDEVCRADTCRYSHASVVRWPYGDQ
jgi:hypothetical protein